ncbi:membrane protein [Streptomyces phage Hiyaa]|uniref:Membrane protein n=1 Tax=Streptomyces phage Hiyaa TaxID=2499072 RepID=A0A3S9U8X0_9CAUD|nr:membrane protein [Streptomyces phage Hiyaa]AZS06710.1 membrane protein [Streptomyces phage Hiyaa]
MIVLATLIALVLIVMGFVSVFREQTMRTPWFYWTWAVVAVLIMSMLIDLPMWVRVANFVVLLASAVLWTRDIKEVAR